MTFILRNPCPRNQLIESLNICRIVRYFYFTYISSGQHSGGLILLPPSKVLRTNDGSRFGYGVPPVAKNILFYSFSHALKYDKIVEVYAI